jgi:hypothetical protein
MSPSIFERLKPRPIDDEDMKLTQSKKIYLAGSFILATGMSVVAFDGITAKRDGISMPEGTNDLRAETYNVPTDSINQSDCGELDRPLLADSPYEVTIVQKAGEFTVVQCNPED